MEVCFMLEIFIFRIAVIISLATITRSFIWLLRQAKVVGFQPLEAEGEFDVLEWVSFAVIVALLWMTFVSKVFDSIIV